MADSPNLISLLDHSIDNFKPNTSQTRIQLIVQAYENSTITARQAQDLLANPDKSLPQTLQTASLAHTTSPGGSAADAPYCFSFQNFRSFLSPSVYGTGGKRLVLPVTPEQVQLSLGNNAATTTSISGRTFTHAAADDLVKISFDSHFPLIRSIASAPSYVTPQFDPASMGTRGQIIFKLLQSMASNQPLIFSVYAASGKSTGESVIAPVTVTITSFERTVKSGNGSDVFYSMSLQKWNPLTDSPGTARKSNSSKPSNDGTKPKQRKYTVSDPETVVQIATKFGLKWRDIVKLNPKLDKLFSILPPTPAGTPGPVRSELAMYTKRKLPKGYTLVLPR